MLVLTAAQIKKAEDNAVVNGIFSYAQMMKNAGEAATKEIVSRYNVRGKNICVICGNGNNGGDGLVIASNLKSYGANVSLLIPLGFPVTDTALNFKSCTQNIKIIQDFSEEYDIIIDALFGIGFNRQPSDDIRELIEKINRYDCIKISIDIPSGLFCDGDEVQTAFVADLTLSFSCYKICQLLPKTSGFCGETVVLDIGIPIDEYSYQTIDKPSQIKRPRNAHKGTFGTALLVCGSYGMCGAEILAARAALRSGVGIVKAIVCDKNYRAFTSAVPEAVCVPVVTLESGTLDAHDATIFSSITNCDALLIGCGLGRGDNVKKIVFQVLNQSSIPTVIDADGINAISDDISIISKSNAPLILTPHPGEMARLCNTTIDDIESNRIEFAKRFAVENNVYLVLKGSNTIIATPDGRIFFNTTGNDGLATGGSGDVLSGMIVSRLAQGYDPLTATLNSVWIHGAAADKLSKTMSTRAIIPSDIIEELKIISD